MKHVISSVLSKSIALLRSRPAPSRTTPDVAWDSTALGASPSADGVHFAVHAPYATGVYVALYDPALPERETERLPMQRDENGVWHAFAAGLLPGALYGFRASGPWNPVGGHWFNEHKLLLDPYAKATVGEPSWRAEMQGATALAAPDTQDSGPVMLKAVVIDDAFDWAGDVPPSTSWDDTLIYELHVKGFTIRHPALPESSRGTYAGLAHPAVVGELTALGVTAVQLLPVHQHLDDGFLALRGLGNYWGYNTMGFFAPHHSYAQAREPQAQVDEFKTMVRELHRAGIEIILDVVYNHTAEGDEKGPLLNLRGLDNAGYYLLGQDAHTVNYTGCGNTVNAASPIALRLIMDSMRYWVEQMHVDGFRFDLGATLGRRGEVFDAAAPFFQAVAQDPVLRKIKLIAEPWDTGPNGYQVGGFPKPWHELNGRYRDKVRRYWAGDATATAAFAKRLCGSQDIFAPSGRSPLSSINLLTSHDGFTLRDLWSYNHKHNEQNGEQNRDGDDNNHSWNCGIEGETPDVAVNALRRRLARSALATLFCSLGVPFLTMGDERWRTQGGNNNAYCQDNEVSWLDWAPADESTAMRSFVTQLLRFRRAH
ncbi:MAG: glycogen debranching enzyme GlgX, partial [Actinobacteria bacterium]|nr:glycogen debranching enzyme GlgX [Actinomycetota bacterium]